MRRLRILTWHVHGAYLYYLSGVAHDLFIPVKPGRPAPYVGIPPGGYPWPANVQEVAADEVPELRLDCVLSQTQAQWLEERERLLSAEQLALPRVHVEHDPPLERPVGLSHPVDDPDALLVHVTPFNELMWESARTPTRVVEHGVSAPEDVRWTGELERGLVVVNNLFRRGPRLGPDVYLRVRERVPLDLVGLGSEGEPGGLGEVPHDRLPPLAARYRFLFNPIRYTSLGLAVLEGMALGMPVVALATTEYATAIENGVSGYVDTSVERLVERTHSLLADPAEARRLGAGARRRALDRFSLDRFVRDWEAVLADVTA